jgi:putative glutathione S-transferase
MGANGWPFANVDPFPAADEDHLYHSKHIKDLYLKVNPDYAGRFAYPLLPMQSDIQPIYAFFF